MTDKSIMLAAGGTGGHLFPAFALSQELHRRGYAVDLITDLRGDKYGSDFPARRMYQVPAATITGKDPVAIFNTLLKLGKGTTRAKAILSEVRPAVICGFGGYPTFPPLLAARLAGIPSVLHEQNAVMGRANRMLAGRVDAIALSFERTIHVEGALAAKARHTGNPVRDAVIAAAATPYPPLAADGPFQLLVFGGSQGARYFSDLLPPALAQLPGDVRGRLRVVQQCREEDLARVEAAYRAAGIVSNLSTFFPDLPGIIANSHLVIARSGASSVSELSVIGRPSILVPLPHALDNDQLRNATFLQEAGGAWCIEQKDLDPARLTAELTRLARDPALLHNAASAAKGVGKPDAVARLGDLVEEVAARRKAA
jgi:UDP-N-acetylglucosamine--N-acetylmuramyl-(pentapeptide) pyrophosphoryl-undecaprenol N-acetylglucosamine transferase